MNCVVDIFMPMGGYIVLPFHVSHEGEVATCVQTALVQLRSEHPQVSIKDIRIEISFESLPK